MSSDTDELVDSSVVVPVEQEEQLALKRDFQPWHRPRKQYIRTYQWCVHLRALAKELAAELKQRPLNYLSLPGDELLDIRSLHGALQPAGVMLRFLGFNSGGGARRIESDLSQHEVRALEMIEGATSVVLNDRLEALADQKSLAWREVSCRAPFDAINLDLCDCLFKNDPGSESGVLAALAELLAIQDSHRAMPWLLFVTTRVDRDLVAPRTLTRLFELIASNSRDAGFAQGMASQLGVEFSDVDAERGGNARLDQGRLARCLVLALGKWMLQIFRREANWWSVELLDAYTYCITDAADVPEMASLAYCFRRPLGLLDSTGLTPKTVQVAVPTELELATAMLGQVAAMKNPDVLLERDPALRAKVTRQCEQLLSAARYDWNAYPW